MRKDRYIGVYGWMLDDPKINANKTRLFAYAKVYGMTNYGWTTAEWLIEKKKDECEERSEDGE